MKLIENRDIKLHGFFNTLFQSMNLAQKNHATQQVLRQKVMMLMFRTRFGQIESVWVQFGFSSI